MYGKREKNVRQLSLSKQFQKQLTYKINRQIQKLTKQLQLYNHYSLEEPLRWAASVTAKFLKCIPLKVFHWLRLTLATKNPETVVTGLHNFKQSVFTFFYVRSHERSNTAQKIRFSNKNFFSKCDQSADFWSHYWRNPWWKTSFSCSVSHPQKNIFPTDSPPTNVSL